MLPLWILTLNAGIMFRSAFLLLEDQSVQKDQNLKMTIHSILSSISLKYGYLDAVVSSVIDAVFKHEQLSLPMADLVSFSESKHNGSRLLVSIVTELSRTSPKVYLREAKGAKSVGDFLVALAERQPKSFSSHISLVLPLLGNEPYVLRSAVVTILGRLVIDVYSPKIEDKETEGRAEAGLSKLQNKDSCLRLLLERFRDTNAFTRSKVLQTWTNMCECNSIPMGHWNEVAKLAIGRLEDKSSLVRKSALQVRH